MRHILVWPMLPAFGNDHFRCMEPREFGAQHLRCAFLQRHRARRNVAAGDADRTAHLGQSRQHIGSPWFEQGFFG